MQSRDLALPLLLLALAGCKSDREAVYVDLSRVAASDFIVLTDPALAAPERPAAIGDRAVAIPGMPRERLVFPNAAKLLERAEMDVRAAQETNFEELRKNLARVYESRAAMEADEHRKKSIGTSDELLAKALADLDALFKAYAPRRGEPLSRLAFLQTQDKTRPRIAEEIATLKAEIAGLDKQFDAEAKSLFADVEAVRAAHKATVEADIERVFFKYRTKAEADARDMTARVSKRLNSELAKLGSVDLPAIPGGESRVTGAPPIGAMPDVRSNVPSGKRDDALKSELEIWLKITGYDLGGSDARDATKEFVEWRRSHGVGR